MTQALEQVQAQQENVAKAIAAYYSGLISAGIPPVFAEILVRDWHVAVFCQSIRAGDTDK